MKEAEARDISTLESEHEALKKQVAKMEKRAYLTPEDEQLIKDLKLQKLAKKDAMSRLAEAGET